MTLSDLQWPSVTVVCLLMSVHDPARFSMTLCYHIITLCDHGNLHGVLAFTVLLALHDPV